MLEEALAQRTTVRIAGRRHKVTKLDAMIRALADRAVKELKSVDATPVSFPRRKQPHAPPHRLVQADGDLRELRMLRIDEGVLLEMSIALPNSAEFVSASDEPEFSGFCFRDLKQQVCNERLQVGESVRPGPKDNDRDRQYGDGLLKRQVAIDGHEDIELFGRKCEQFAILDCGPAHLAGTLDIMTNDSAG